MIYLVVTGGLMDALMVFQAVLVLECLATLRTGKFFSTENNPGKARKLTFLTYVLTHASSRVPDRQR